jgi:hypothetical protein
LGKCRSVGRKASEEEKARWKDEVVVVGEWWVVG